MPYPDLYIFVRWSELGPGVITARQNIFLFADFSHLLAFMSYTSFLCFNAVVCILVFNKIFKLTNSVHIYWLKLKFFFAEILRQNKALVLFCFFLTILCYLSINFLLTFFFFFWFEILTLFAHLFVYSLATVFVCLCSRGKVFTLLYLRS